MKNKKKGLLAAYGMVLPAFLVVMLTVAYPIVSAVIQSFQDENTGAFTLRLTVSEYRSVALMTMADSSRRRSALTSLTRSSTSKRRALPGIP